MATMFCTEQSSLLPYAKERNESPKTAYKNVVTAVGHRYKKYGLREGGVEKGEGARRTHEISGIVVANHHGQQNWQCRRCCSRQSRGDAQERVAVKEGSPAA